MGLDISAYEHVELIKAQPEGWDEKLGDQDGVVCLYPNDDFPGRNDDLVRGYYRVSGQDGYQSFSYSGYSRWREWLSKTFIGVEPDRVWEEPETYADSPFFELVNFADNEGFIGPKTSAKLAADFAAHEPRTGTDWDREAYARLARMFRLAGGGGAVKFY